MWALRAPRLLQSLKPPSRSRHATTVRAHFSTTRAARSIRSIWDLENAHRAIYTDCTNSHLENLTYSHGPPRNVLIVKKNGVATVTDDLVEFSKYLVTTHPATKIILEPKTAALVHGFLPFAVYTTPYTTLPPYPNKNPYHLKTSLLVTLGGDGTILHASSLFSTSPIVPPVLSFARGTLGFLGPWAWKDYRLAIAEVWGSTARVLRRKRLRMGVWDKAGNRVRGELTNIAHAERDEGELGVWAMNEVNIHRGRDPHLAIVEVFVDGRFLTEAVADGIILSTPTGSTAYSLSSFGSIVHPRVSALLLTPICPRSLSFRPLVLPAESNITLRLSEKNRGREVEVSVDGQRWGGVGVGVEVRVTGETVDESGGVKGARGGIPCIWRGASDMEEGWVGGLNGLLKFNYPFGLEDDV